MGELAEVIEDGFPVNFTEAVEGMSVHGVALRLLPGLAAAALPSARGRGLVVEAYELAEAFIRERDRRLSQDMNDRYTVAYDPAEAGLVEQAEARGRLDAAAGEDAMLLDEEDVGVQNVDGKPVDDIPF